MRSIRILELNRMQIPEPRHEFPLVSVVMAVRNEAGYIEATLDTVLNQDYPGDIEIVVADGMSTDGTSDLLRLRAARNPSLRVVENPERSAAGGLNRAIASCRGEVVVRCDGHSELPPDYVRLAVEILRQTGAANVGGRQMAEGTTLLERAVAIAMTTPFAVGDARFRYSSVPGPTDTVYLGAFPRDVLDGLGGFDTGLIRNQDYELNYRIRRTGGIVWFDPRLQATYRPRSSIPKLWRQYLDYGKWKRVMLMRNPGSLAARQTAPPLLVIGLVLSAVTGVAGFPLWWVIPSSYAAFLGAATIVESIRRRDRAAGLLPVVIPSMHLAWGLGFLLLRSRR